MIRLILLALTFNFALFSQSLKPIPTIGGTKFFFENQFNFEVTSVSIAGNFNNWNKSEFKMNYSEKDNLWTGVVKLIPGIEFHYKLVINDSLWITDPNAHDITEDEWRNGIIIAQEFGVPFIKEMSPPNNKRIEEIDSVSITLGTYNSRINTKSIRVAFNDSEIAYNYDSTVEKISFKVPNTIQDGEHKIFLSFADEKGNQNKGIISKFFLDRYINSIITPKFYDSSIMYEIYIRKFYDSDDDGTGDFNGLTQKLDYLTFLGINSLWLMPWNESTTEHGYNVVDYYSIDQEYGTFEDYLNFLREAKKRGIKVLFDFVINHTDRTHPYFLDAYKNPSSPYTKWYQFVNEENSNWKHFGVERKMPKLDFENPEVRNYFIQVAKFWMDPNRDGDFGDGIDGFRCDAAKEVPHSFWNTLRKEIKSINPEVLLLGEVWDNANFLIPFFKEEFDMQFDYPFYYSLERFFERNEIERFSSKILEASQIYPSGFQMVRFLSNHDNPRPINFMRNNHVKLKQALTILFSLPGTPMIYYGDELGYAGSLPPENVRQQFDWDKLDKSVSDENSLFSFYKKLIEIRKNNIELSGRHDREQETLRFLKEKSNSLLVYLRTIEEKKTLVIINNSEKNISEIELQLDESTTKFLESSDKGVVLISSDQTNTKKEVPLQIVGNSLFLQRFSLEAGGYILLKIK